MNICKSSKHMEILWLINAILFIFLLLTNTVNSIALVNIGLTTWYKNMIPSLFPFMVLSGFMLRTGISSQISSLLNPILGKIFRLSPNCIYVIIMGFLCGFPMGANVIAQSLSLSKITKREAELLLAFCNNIGPIYVISFATAACPFYPIWITMLIMYGLPLLYGFILRYTHYKDIPYCVKNEVTNNCPYVNSNNSNNYLNAFQESLQKAITSIVTLGAYMIIFNVLQLPLYNTFYQGTVTMVNAYNELNDVKITKVNIGTRANKMDLLQFSKNASEEEWVDPEALQIPGYAGDAKGQQIVVYNKDIAEKGLKYRNNHLVK